VKFVYEVKAVYSLTYEELTGAIECAKTHYDLACREAAQPGGFLFYWHNHFAAEAVGAQIEKGATSESELSSHELDLLCKILESPKSDDKLYAKCCKFLSAQHDEWCRRNGLPNPKRG
jgi:hypothetical protein